MLFDFVAYTAAGKSSLKAEYYRSLQMLCANAKVRAFRAGACPCQESSSTTYKQCIRKGYATFRRRHRMYLPFLPLVVIMILRWVHRSRGVVRELLRIVCCYSWT